MKPFFDTREFRWRLKQGLRWSPVLTKRRGISANAQQRFNADQLTRFAELHQRHVITDWPGLCDQTEYIENLYVLDLLAQHVPAVSPDGRGLDIGCRNFSHLPALSAFMPGVWDGVELDAYARYMNGYTRKAYGEWMARQRAGSRYIAGSLLEVSGSYDLIIWILPFILRAPLRAWGLPARFFQPLELLQHAYSLLKPGGVMMIVNQGDVEAQEQQRLFDEAGITARALGEVQSVFSPFRNKRCGYIVERR